MPLYKENKDVYYPKLRSKATRYKGESYVLEEYDEEDFFLFRMRLKKSWAERHGFILISYFFALILFIHGHVFIPQGMTTNYIEIFRVFPELLIEIIVVPLFLILTCHLDNWIKKVYEHYSVLLILEKKDERLYIATHEIICIDEAIYLEDIAYFFVAVGLNRHFDGTVEKIDGSTRQCYRLCVKLKNKK